MQERKLAGSYQRGRTKCCLGDIKERIGLLKNELQFFISFIHRRLKEKNMHAPTCSSALISSLDRLK